MSALFTHHILKLELIFVYFLIRTMYSSFRDLQAVKHVFRVDFHISKFAELVKLNTLS